VCVANAHPFLPQFHHERDRPAASGGETAGKRPLQRARRAHRGRSDGARGQVVGKRRRIIGRLKGREGGRAVVDNQVGNRQIARVEIVDGVGDEVARFGGGFVYGFGKREAALRRDGGDIVSRDRLGGQGGIGAAN